MVIIFKRGVLIHPSTQFSFMHSLWVPFVCMQSFRLIGFMVLELWRTHIYILSWPKILAPLHFFQIMHHFFQKIVEILKSFDIHICISLVCSGTKQKKAEKITKSSFSPHGNPKMAWTILLAPFRSCSKQFDFKQVILIYFGIEFTCSELLVPTI